MRLSSDGPTGWAARETRFEQYARTASLTLLFLGSPAFGAQQDTADPEVALSSAPVEVDGTVLFHVRGVEAYPAEKRAEAVARRIVALARDHAFRAHSLRVVESEIGTDVLAASQRVVVVTDTHARGAA